MVFSLAPAADLPVSLHDLKALLRIEHDIEDALLAALLRTATEVAEHYIGHVLLRRGFEQRTSMDSAASLHLLRGPFVQIISISVNAVVLAATDYALSSDAYGEEHVDILSAGRGDVAVQFVAGMAADWNDIPEAVRFGILRHAAHLYAHRDNPAASAMPSAVQALWQPFRKVRLS